MATNNHNVIISIFETSDGEIEYVDINIPILFRTDRNGYYVQSPVLKTIGFSTTSLEAAHLDHDIDVDIFFKAHFERGTLRSALSNLGWSKKDDRFEYQRLRPSADKGATFQSKRVAAVA